MALQNMRNSVGAQYGEIRIEPLSAEDEAHSTVKNLKGASTTLSIYTWHPADEICNQLPDSFRLRFYCSTDSDSVRRFYPIDGFDKLILDLFKSGLAIFDNLKKMSDHQRWSYRLMSLLFQKVRGLCQHYSRNFQGIKDLNVKRSGRNPGDSHDVLPDDLGISFDRKGRRWGIPQMKEEGRKLAEENGHDNLTMKQLIEHGLFAAAMRNPLQISNPQEIEGLLRFALYDIPQGAECHDEMKEWIEEQILAAIELHKHDTQEKFAQWFSGPKNSFIKQIAKKKCPYGELTNKIVQRVLLDLGWQSYTYMAGCLNTQMRCFQYAMPESLSGKEREIFEMIYLQQEYFSNLPLVLLQERIPFLKAPMLSVLSGRNDFDFVGTLHRLLCYYSTMVDTRREADLLAKNYSLACREQNRTVQTFNFDEDHPVEDKGIRHHGKNIYDDENDDWDT